MEPARPIGFHPGVRIGLYVSADATTPLSQVLDRFEQAEAAGFHTAWAGQTFDWDALTLLALAGRVTRRIELGTWVVPTYPRHPSALAHQALTVQAACGGRLLLGIGVSHEAVVARRLGLDYAHPLRHMREYLEVLQPLLAGRAVKHEGEEFRIDLQVGTLGAEPPAVLVAALGPKMLALAGRSADGVAIWLGGPRYLGGFAVPAVTEAARAAGRPVPRIVSGLPIAVSTAADARASAEAHLARSSRLPVYRRVLAREGAAGPADVAIVGDEEHVARRIDEIAALGVSDLNVVPILLACDPGAVPRTIAFLGERAREGPGRGRGR